MITLEKHKLGPDDNFTTISCIVSWPFRNAMSTSHKDMHCNAAPRASGTELCDACQDRRWANGVGRRWGRMDFNGFSLDSTFPILLGNALYLWKHMVSRDRALTGLYGICLKLLDPSLANPIYVAPTRDKLLLTGASMMGSSLCDLLMQRYLNESLCAKPSAQALIACKAFRRHGVSSHPSGYWPRTGLSASDVGRFLVGLV